LGGCAETAREEREAYVVRPHDTLYSIAWRYNIDYRDLARWNHLASDFHIVVGQRLLLSGPLQAKSAVAGSRAGASAGKEAQSTASSNARAGKPSGSASNPAGSAGSAETSTQKWVWPTDRVSPPRPVPGGGILLSGRVGQDIRAACAGRVVYSGSGIRGYEILIIIKHGENLLSAYAHNRESLVHEGEEVAVGQVIAHMGEGAPQTPVLYFEIRRNGKPIDPQAFLSNIK
jgi:lipoprotein NlpD